LVRIDRSPRDKSPVYGYFFIRFEQEQANKIASKHRDASNVEFLSLRATENIEPFHAHFLYECMNGWDDDESAIAACDRRSPPVQLTRVSVRSVGYQ
jgi:hypothetical protein